MFIIEVRTAISPVGDTVRRNSIRTDPPDAAFLPRLF